MLYNNCLLTSPKMHRKEQNAGKKAERIPTRTAYIYRYLRLGRGFIAAIAVEVAVLSTWELDPHVVVVFFAVKNHFSAAAARLLVENGQMPSNLKQFSVLADRSTEPLGKDSSCPVQSLHDS